MPTFQVNKRQSDEVEFTYRQKTNKYFSLGSLFRKLVGQALSGKLSG